VTQPRIELADSISRSAHELNNLCASVLGYAVLAEDALDPASPVAPFLSEIREAAERVATVAQELRRMAHRLRGTEEP
jgi:signal transduction histidine kinase